MSNSRPGPETASLARRYGFKLLANMASVPVYLAMEAILPRALGPAMYGNFSFATNFFQQLSGFLDMGTSTCFYNALSRRQAEWGLASFYLRIALLVGLFGLLIATLFCYAPIGALFMPDVPLWLAPLAALWAFLTWAGRVLRSLNDALGATVASELMRSALAILAVLVLCALFFSGYLNIWTLFAQQYLLLASTGLAYWLVSLRHWQARNIQPELKLTPVQRKSYEREFFDYSHPLFVQALLSFFMLTAERWLLQWFDGSHQQGFYALSQKVSMACFLFVSAMTPLLMREFSIAWGARDLDGIGRLLTRFAPMLYALAAYFSCFTLAEGQTLVEIFGGSEFVAAILPVQIMALYPVHQGYGQIAGSVFHAAGRTRTLRNITALECVYGFSAAWFLLAPPSLFGLNLGATGLAIKTVAVQCVTVNICLWLASRMLPFDFWRNLAHQVLCLCAFLSLAFISRKLSLEMGLGLDSLARFVLSGLIYSSAILGLCLGFPRLFGLSRQELRELYLRFVLSHRKK